MGSVVGDGYKREYFAKRAGLRFEVWFRVQGHEFVGLYDVKFWRFRSAFKAAQALQVTFNDGWWSYHHAVSE